MVMVVMMMIHLRVKNLWLRLDHHRRHMMRRLINDGSLMLMRRRHVKVLGRYDVALKV